VKNRTTVERKSDREVVVTRTINGPARIVFEAFSKAELLKRWWVPKSMGMTLLSCEVDARVGGKYRLVFDLGGAEPAAFFGSYVEVKRTWKTGDVVEAGQPLVVLQAMKMENELSLPRGGTIKSVAAEPGQSVEQGQVLVVLE